MTTSTREEIRIGQLAIRFLVEGDASGGTVSVFEFRVPAGATRVNLAGKTVMPSLIDTHNHLSQTREMLINDLKLRHYYGVTAAQSMGQDTTNISFQVREETREGKIPGAARFFTAGRGMTGVEPGRTMAPHWLSSPAEGRAAVEYMLRRAGYRDVLPTQQPPAAPTPRAAERAAPTRERQTAPVDDKTITANVAEALRGAPDVSPPNAQLETYEGVTTIRGVGIKVETRDGVVTLRGVIDDVKVISRAESLARTVSGVRGVDNKLVQAALFEHD